MCILEVCRNFHSSRGGRNFERGRKFKVPYTGTDLSVIQQLSFENQAVRSMGFLAYLHVAHTFLRSQPVSFVCVQKRGYWLLV